MHSPDQPLNTRLYHLSLLPKMPGIAFALASCLGLMACTHQRDASTMETAPQTSTSAANSTNPGAESDTDTVSRVPASPSTTSTTSTAGVVSPGERSGSVRESEERSGSMRPSEERRAAVAPAAPEVVTAVPSVRDTITSDEGQEENETGSEASEKAADNSAVNQRHTDLTAADQSNDPSDLEITRQIRKSLTSNDALSTYAQNVKIITREGSVVLKGPVRSLDEKETVEAAARRVAGNTQVSSEITISAR